MDFFTHYKAIIIILHAFGAALGIGSATVSDILFFRSLKDGKISQGESSTLKVMTRLVWIALSLIILTGLMLLLSDIPKYLASSKFIVKMIIVGILTLNGIIITLVMHKRMKDMSFVTRRHRIFKRIGFAQGALSVSSWYLAFLLGSLRSIPYTVKEGLGIYLIILLLAVSGSQIMYSSYKHRFSKEN